MKRWDEMFQSKSTLFYKCMKKPTQILAYRLLCISYPLEICIILEKERHVTADLFDLTKT